MPKTPEGCAPYRKDDRVMTSEILSAEGKRASFNSNGALKEHFVIWKVRFESENAELF